MAALTDKEEQFAQEYLVDLNATKAAIRAGYSEKTARQAASRLLSNVNIQERIAELMQKRSEKTGITAERVLNEVANIAFGNMRDYVEFGPAGISFKDSKELTDAQMARVSEVSSETKEFNGVTTTNVKFKTYAKDSALRDLMRHLGLFEKDNSQSTPIINTNLQTTVFTTKKHAPLPDNKQE